MLARRTTGGRGAGGAIGAAPTSTMGGVAGGGGLAGAVGPAAGPAGAAGEPEAAAGSRSTRTEGVPTGALDPVPSPPLGQAAKSTDAIAPAREVRHDIGVNDITSRAASSAPKCSVPERL